jgi:hypothetical protein
MWPRSGALPALSWLKKFWYVPEFPFGPVCTFTWMPGLALFHSSTTFWISGTQEVNVNVTGPLDGTQLAVPGVPVAESSPPEEQAVNARVPTRMAATERMRMIPPS